MIVIGLDPGFANLGWSILRVPDSGPLTPTFVDAGVIRTAAAHKKRKIVAADDLVVRTRQLRHGLVSLTVLEVPEDGHRRDRSGVLSRRSAIEVAGLVASEEMAWGFKGIRAHRQLGMAWGVIVSACEEHGKGLVTVSPGDLKQTLTGSRSSSKEAVAEALALRPGFETFAAHLLTFPAGKREHVADATAAALVALETDAAKFFRGRA